MIKKMDHSFSPYSASNVKPLSFQDGISIEVCIRISRTIHNLAGFFSKKSMRGEASDD